MPTGAASHRAARAGLALGGFVAASLTVLLVLQGWAAPQIAEIERERRLARVRAAAPVFEQRAALTHRRMVVAVPPGCRTPLEAVHRLEDRDGMRVRVLEVLASDGYSGPIELLIGLGTDRRIDAIVVGAHRETPGIGDRIEASKSDWLAQLLGYDPDTPARYYRTRRDGGELDALAGATITTRAVLRGVEKALAATAGSNPAAGDETDASVAVLSCEAASANHRITDDG